MIKNVESRHIKIMDKMDNTGNNKTDNNRTDSTRTDRIKTDSIKTDKAKKPFNVEPPKDEKERIQLEVEAERTERVLATSRSMIGAVITIFLLLIYSLYHGEPGSASYVVSQMTMGICALFFLYCIYITRKYIRLKESLREALRLSAAPPRAMGDGGENGSADNMDAARESATGDMIAAPVSGSIFDRMEHILAERGDTPRLSDDYNNQ